ncbi:MAG: NeuD/PglB/VioB family sugar acetyltransferase [Bacteroidia bacterium]
MIIIGAKGHAKELLDLFRSQDDVFYFFDNVSVDLGNKIFGQYNILTKKEDVEQIFHNDKRFVIGVGVPKIRFELSEMFRSWGGELTSVISSTASIGQFNVNMQEGLNIMHNVVIFNDVFIGEGSLINTAASIHHDVHIGKYCEISPGARILGGAQIGEFTTVGTGAIILPKIKVGKNVIVGAGAVVDKDVSDNTTVVGIPAKPRT